VSLFDLLDESARASTRIRFPTLDRVVTFGETWTTSARVAGWLCMKVGEGAIAMLMDTSPECLAVLLGSLRSDRRTASLPLPGRSTRSVEYERTMRTVMTQLDVSLLVVDARAVPMLPPLPARVMSFQDVVTAAGATRPHEEEATTTGEFIQFSSGSTARPKGIRLSVDQIAQNVLAILERLAPEHGDGACSWLPLSHDMGLIGMTLSSLVAGGRRYANGGELVLIPPEHFLRDPSVWLEVCSRHGSTITASPDFALGMVMRRIPTGPGLALGRLRACIVGGEPVRATTLRNFSRSFEPFGFRANAFCPSYGSAEATLGVTMVSPEESWRALRLDRDALAAGVIAPTADGDVEVVSTGPPLDGINVTAAPGRPHAGSISIEGPSVFDGYLGGPSVAGRFETSDVGFLDEGHLYVLGRSDDVLVVRGRNLHVHDLEDAVESLAEVRSGSCAVVPAPPGYAVVIEVVPSGSVSQTPLEHRVRAVLVERCGVAPVRVLTVDRGEVPKTSSGKKQRRELSRRLAAGDVDVLPLER
jgi:acyl-CoA synthetase (AMP-forming)/AMP-acid ligase II